MVQRSLGAAHPLAQSLARCQPRPGAQAAGGSTRLCDAVSRGRVESNLPDYELVTPPENDFPLGGTLWLPC